MFCGVACRLGQMDFAATISNRLNFAEASALYVGVVQSPKAIAAKASQQS